MNNTEWLFENKLVAIARRVPVESISEAAFSLWKGGIKSIEITFDQASATCIQDTVQSIKNVKRKMGERVLVGAGTVLTLEQAEAAYEAGASFALSPDVNTEIIKRVKELGMISIPGAMTPTEVMTAWNSGADIVKLFPAGILGLEYYKAIKGPISHVPLMAVGGVDSGNVNFFLDAGFCSCGIGSNLVRNDLIKEGRFDELTNIAMEYTGNKRRLS